MLSLTFFPAAFFLSVPYWEVTANIRSLSIHYSFCRNAFQRIRAELVETEELQEEELTSFELPSSPIEGTAEEEQALRCSIAFRTIIAAAKGGRLRSLKLSLQDGFQKPFAVRSLLPCWVGVEAWKGWSPSSFTSHPITNWAGAAAHYAPLLLIAHCGCRSLLQELGTIAFSPRRTCKACTPTSARTTGFASQARHTFGTMTTLELILSSSFTCLGYETMQVWLRRSLRHGMQS